jgi:tetrahydromethanopterin S-methyltransferase subunit G
MSTFDKLDDAFNIVPQDTVSETEIVKLEDDIKDIEKDYEYSREQLYNLIGKGQEAIDGIMDVARNSDHPRAYEVAFQGIKNIADMTDKLIDLQKKMKTMDEDSSTRKGPSTVNNTMFIGSTAELQKFLKQSKINNTEEI